MWLFCIPAETDWPASLYGSNSGLARVGFVRLCPRSRTVNVEVEIYPSEISLPYVNRIDELRSLKYRIIKERQSFAFGIYCVQLAVRSGGLDTEVATQLLDTTVAHDPQIVGQSLPMDIKGNTPFQQGTVNHLAGAFLVMVTEIAMGNDAEVWEKYFTKNPMMEFLKHVRHGVAHGNEFDFKHGIKHPAVWRGLELTEEGMKGSRVFSEIADESYYKKDTEIEKGLLEAGDAFALADGVIQLIDARIDHPPRE